MSEAYFRVESGALGPEENFLSLDDILLSHEKLPVRTETPMPRLGVFFPERSRGTETDNTIPQVSLSARTVTWKGCDARLPRCPLGFVVPGWGRGRARRRFRSQVPARASGFRAWSAPPDGRQICSRPSGSFQH